MTVEEMISRYNITPETNDYGKTYTGRLKIWNIKALKEDDAEELLRKNKSVIMEYFEKERARKIERDQRIESIEGLREILSAQEELAEWHRRFNESFEGEGAVGGIGVGPKPEHDMDAMYERYPRAAAYIKAQQYTLKENLELSKIGNDALDEVIFGDYRKAITDLENRLQEFTKKHIWD